jgi:hypothetical protein
VRVGHISHRRLHAPVTVKLTASGPGDHLPSRGTRRASRVFCQFSTRLRLTRIPHRLSAASADTTVPAALRSVGLLTVSPRIRLRWPRSQALHPPPSPPLHPSTPLRTGDESRREMRVTRMTFLTDPATAGLHRRTRPRRRPSTVRRCSGQAKSKANPNAESSKSQTNHPQRWPRLVLRIDRWIKVILTGCCANTRRDRTPRQSEKGSPRGDWGSPLVRRLAVAILLPDQ